MTVLNFQRWLVHVVTICLFFSSDAAILKTLRAMNLPSSALEAGTLDFHRNPTLKALSFQPSNLRCHSNSLSFHSLPFNWTPLFSQPPSCRPKG